MQALNKPKLEEAEPIVSRSLANKELLLIIGSCSVDYRGRASSKMGEGERIVMVKEDSSLTVHKKDRHAPVNYQTAGCEMKAYLEDDKLVLESYKRKVQDHITIKFSSLNFVGNFKLKDEEDITVAGKEKDWVKMVLAQPELVEEGLRTEKVEKRISTGGIDIYCKDKDGNYVIVEMKRRTAGLNEVNQLKRYVDEMNRTKKEKVRGILCAPRLSPNAKDMLHRNGLEFVKLDPSIEKFEEGVVDLRKDQKSLGEFVK
ncbi:MAG: endonuclease NucS [archaeon]